MYVCMYVYILFKIRKLDIDFQCVITKLVEMIQATYLSCEGDYSVSVQNSISGNLPGTWTQAYVWHRGGRNVSIVYDHQEPWWQLDNSEAGKQSNVQHVVWHCHVETFHRVLASPFAHLLDCLYHVFDSVKIIHCQSMFFEECMCVPARVHAQCVYTIKQVLFVKCLAILKRKLFCRF